MPTDNPMDEDAVENDLDSECQQTATKQSANECNTQNASEITELESESPAVNKCVKLINSQRSSNRLTKRSKKDNSEETILKKTVNLKQDAPSVRSKTRRPWELWSVEDKNAFFEALCEYGKDFESIQSYIAQRGKKKGTATNMIKNKDQVRHFYYRTWHKISKFLEISECVQKQTQELYGLINYAELRKKIGGCLNEKNRLKLNELVFSGVTTVKYKGKKLRIKTPVCRALKKLNNFADSKEPDSEKLPKDIFVEFRPYTNTAWLQVQNLAQNPRVRTKVCLQKRLRPVIEYLQKRWRPYRLKRKEQVLNCLPNHSSEEICDIQPILRVKPARGVKIFPLSMSAIDTASSSDVCLEKYMKLSHKSLCKDINKSKKVMNTKLKPLSDKPTDNGETVLEKLDSTSDNPVHTIGEPCDIHSSIDISDLSQKANKNMDDNSYINVLTPPKSVPELDQPNEQNSYDVQRPFSSLTSVIDSSTKHCVLSDNLNATSKETDCRTLLCNSNLDLLNESEQNLCNEINVEPNVPDYFLDDISILNLTTAINSKKDFPSDTTTEKEKILEEKTDICKSKNASEDCDSVYSRTIRHGWTVDEAGFLTFGELYLLFGKPATISLEYEFEYPKTSNSTEGETERIDSSASELSPVLNKVFEIAQAYFTDSKHKQISGKQHGRNSSAKSTKLKTCGLNDKASKDFQSSQIITHIESNLPCKDVNNSDILISNSPAVSSDYSSSQSSSSDKHVFVMPVGTAPRTIKHTDQSSLKEEIGKLLPCTRRGCRVRRKPLVVQRPLLPREGMRPLSGARPMTVVHLVPSVSPLTTVLPSSCPRPKNKINIPPAKKMVNILSAGTAVDLHPIQVPVLKQLHPDSGQNVILHRNSISPHVIVNPSAAEPLHIINNPMTCVNVPVCESILAMQSRSSQDQNQLTLPKVGLSSSTDINTLHLDLLSGHSQNINESKENYTSLSELSLSEGPTSLLTNVPSSSFLDEFALVSRSEMYDTSNMSSCLNVDIAASKECSSSENPTFRMNSAEIQWFNGESTELSLNTFLNSMESPSKMAPNIATENSNLDPIGRLAPVVDSQVRCLLDECSIDFITKFEDLADVINNSSSSDSKQT